MYLPQSPLSDGRALKKLSLQRNSEDVAKKHYLKVTDGHMSAGSLLRASQKAGPKAGPELAVMPSHAVSAKSQTLENKAYHVMSYHDMPAIGGQVGDEGLKP